MKLLALLVALLAVGCDPPLAPTMSDLAQRQPAELSKFLLDHMPENHRGAQPASDDELRMMNIPIESGMIFGDGSDGPCTWDGTTTVKGDAPAAPNAQDTVPAGTTAVYDLSSWRFCSTATVSLHVAVHGIYPIFVDGNLQLDGAIINNGCTSNSVSAGCPNTAGGGSGLMNRGTGSESANTGLSCFFKPLEFDQSGLGGICGTGGTIGGGAGGNGINAGCGGGGGAACNGGVAGRASPTNTSSISVFGLGDITMNDGYIAYVNGLNGTGCAGTSGGALGVVGINTTSPGGGGAGWIVVHAKTITGSGTLEARGGNAIGSATSTSNCSGGGGGGGGGIVSVLIASGSYPTTNITGGLGVAGTLCIAPGGCAGGQGGHGGNGHDGLLEPFRQ